MYEHSDLGYSSGFALCLTKVRSSRARCPATALIRHFSLLNVTAAGACGYDFPCDGERLVRAYLRRRRGTT